MEESQNEYYNYVSKVNTKKGLHLEEADIEKISAMYVNVLEDRGIYEEKNIKTNKGMCF